MKSSSCVISAFAGKGFSGGFDSTDPVCRVSSASQSPFPASFCNIRFRPLESDGGDRHLYLTDFQNFTPGFASFDLAFFYCSLDLLYRYRTVDGALLSRMQSVLVDAYLNGHEEAGFLEMKQPLRCLRLFD